MPAPLDFSTNLSHTHFGHTASFGIQFFGSGHSRERLTLGKIYRAATLFAYILHGACSRRALHLKLIE